MSSQALARWRRCHAVELVLQGMKYDEVARQVGYANRGTAHRAVAQALSERLVDGIDELRALEVARLDAMQAALWPPQVEAGDTRASMTVIRIIDRRCRLLGLDATKRARQRFDTLVIGEESNPGEATDERPETAGEVSQGLPAA